MPAPKWGGFKLGVELGYGHGYAKVKPGDINDSSSSSAHAFSHSEEVEAHELGESINFGAKGVLGGVHAAWDFQFARNWIVGAEASFDFVQNSLGKYTVAVVPRVGYGLNDSLFYVGAGWAGSKFSHHGSDFNSAFRLALGAAQKMGRVLLGVEGDYDFYQKNMRVLSAKLKLSFML